MRHNLHVLHNVFTWEMRDLWEDLRAVTLVYVLIVLVMYKLADDQDRHRKEDVKLTTSQRLYLVLLLVFSYCSVIWTVYDKHW